MFAPITTLLATFVLILVGVIFLGALAFYLMEDLTVMQSLTAATLLMTSTTLPHFIDHSSPSTQLLIQVYNFLASATFIVIITIAVGYLLINNPVEYELENLRQRLDQGIEKTQQEHETNNKQLKEIRDLLKSLDQKSS